MPTADPSATIGGDVPDDVKDICHAITGSGSWNPDKEGGRDNLLAARAIMADRAARPAAQAEGASFAIGDAVVKFTGDYQWSGEVRAVFATRFGRVRYVVEHEVPGSTGGVLHIYGPQNLRPLTAPPEQESDR